MKQSPAMRMVVCAIALTAAVGLALAGCAPARAGRTPVPGSELAIEGAEARPGPAGGIGGAFFSVVNSGATADRLLAVRSPVAPTSELHETFDDNGVLRMRLAPNGFEVPARGRLDLGPGGKHVMFVDLTQQVKVGSQITMTLVFQKAGEVTLTVPVKQ